MPKSKTIRNITFCSYLSSRGIWSAVDKSSISVLSTVINNKSEMTIEFKMIYFFFYRCSNLLHLQGRIREYFSTKTLDCILYQAADYVDNV